MSKGIIDGFKIIYVDIDDGIGMFFGYLIEVFPIIEPCQRILVDFMGMFQLGTDDLIESSPFESLTDHEDFSVIGTHIPKGKNRCLSPRKIDSYCPFSSIAFDDIIRFESHRSHRTTLSFVIHLPMGIFPYEMQIPLMGIPIPDQKFSISIFIYYIDP